MEELADILYGGIRPEIPGHGGKECAGFLSPSWMVLETLLSTAMMVTVGVIGWYTCTMPKTFPKDRQTPTKQFILVLLCLVFGIEVGYKICSKQVLYLLNPCHIITGVEIFLLAAQPSKLSFSILRGLMHYVYGAMIAILFPDTMCRFFPGEVVVYWLQHILIFFVVPPFLVYTWGPKSLEPSKEWAWACFAGIAFGVHNHYILQPVALLSHVNLNYVLCPATVDPFNGPYYRTAAIFHQAVCLLTIGKVYTLIIKGVLSFLPRFDPKQD